MGLEKLTFKTFDEVLDFRRRTKDLPEAQLKHRTFVAEDGYSYFLHTDLKNEKIVPNLDALYFPCWQIEGNKCVSDTLRISAANYFDRQKRKENAGSNFKQYSFMSNSILISSILSIEEPGYFDIVKKPVPDICLPVCEYSKSSLVLPWRVKTYNNACVYEKSIAESRFEQSCMQDKSLYELISVYSALKKQGSPDVATTPEVKNVTLEEASKNQAINAIKENMLDRKSKRFPVFLLLLWLAIITVIVTLPFVVGMLIGIACFLAAITTTMIGIIAYLGELDYRREQAEDQKMLDFLGPPGDKPGLGQVDISERLDTCSAEQSHSGEVSTEDIRDSASAPGLGDGPATPPDGSSQPPVSAQGHPLPPVDEEPDGSCFPCCFGSRLLNSL